MICQNRHMRKSLSNRQLQLNCGRYPHFANALRLDVDLVQARIAERGKRIKTLAAVRDAGMEPI